MHKCTKFKMLKHEDIYEFPNANPRTKGIEKKMEAYIYASKGF